MHQKFNFIELQKFAIKFYSSLNITENKKPFFPFYLFRLYKVQIQINISNKTFTKASSQEVKKFPAMIAKCVPCTGH